jgi:hypothetical protein
MATFTIWRKSIDGHMEYAIGWNGDTAAHSSSPDEALKCASKTAAQYAIESRSKAGWSVKVTEE